MSKGNGRFLKNSDLLHELHTTLGSVVDGVDHIACVLYDPKDGKLRTYLDSPLHGSGITGYEYALEKSKSLSGLAENGGYRLLRNLPSVLHPDTAHSAHLLEQGFQTSLTFPMYRHGDFMGFVFLDSLDGSAFPEEKIPILQLWADHISLLIGHELDLISALYGAVALSRAFCRARDFETASHLERVARYAKLVAHGLETSHGLSDEFVEHVYLFAPLHDLGKVSIPDSILHKPGKLTADEWAIMKTHPEAGVRLLDTILESMHLDEIPDIEIARNIVLGHHEMMDGSGYPNGWKGERIPLEARIIAVADTFDALTTRRPYKEPWSLDRALEKLSHMAEIGKLDPDCVLALQNQAEEVRNIHRDQVPDLAKL